MKKRFTNISKLFLALIVCFALTSKSTFAQEEEESKFSMNVTLNSDIFFGFYPFFAGSYAISDKVDFTFYGILWSGGAAGGSWGNWTEFGAGVNFKVSESLNINPQIGLLSGSLTSGLGAPVLGEGFVPNLTVGLNNDFMQGELYMGYYVGIDHGNPNTNNYLHYWINSGYKVAPFMTLGLHYEQLDFTGGKNVEEDSNFSFYQALGPFVQFADPNGSAFARFSTGFDLRSDEKVVESNFEQGTFYKLTVGFGF